jgi:tetratricopeptide (TPR) repeat protein
MTFARRGLALALGFALAACAGPRPRGAGSPLDALVVEGDGALGAAQAPALVARRPDDPWARLTAALVARRAADATGEAAQLLALAAAAPAHPLAPVALRRLTDLADESPEIGRAVEAALAPLAPRLAGLAAYRARVARIAAAEALGDHARVAALRVENGAITAWTLAGPLGVRRAIDFVRPVPGEDGVLPEVAPGRLGGPPRPARTLPAPDGTIALEGEPMDADVFLLASDVTLARGGRYLVTLGTGMSARLTVDGVVVHERRDFAAHLPSVVHVPVDLERGVHRVVVKVSRGGERVGLHVAFAREDGAPSDLSSAPVRPGTPPPAAPRPRPGPVAFTPADLAAALAPEAGRPLAAWLAGLDAALVDRETAKALLAEAAAALPRSAMVRASRAAVVATDPTLDEQVAQGRGEAELREALARDPGHLGVRVALSSMLRSAGRLDEAEEVLAPAAGAAAPPPALAVALARVAEARGLAERAEALLAGALGAGARCRALDLGRELASRRRAIALEDERVRARAECRDGRERLAEHLRRRGDAAGAAAALAPVVAARPWAVEPSIALAGAHVATGDLARAAGVLEALRAIWPRSARVEKRLADVRELLGDAAAARAARERALLADGADLALRRDLALEDGREVLDDWVEDAGSALRAYQAADRAGDTSAIMILDGATVEFHPGGAHTERTQQVILVRDPRGVDKHGEVSLPPGSEVLAVRTLKRDGRSLEPELTGGKGTISLAGLEPGDSVLLDYVRAVRPEPGGASSDPFFFREDTSRLWRSTYAVVAAEGVGVEIEASGMAAPPPAREKGRLVWRFRADDVAPRVPEPNQPSIAELLPFVAAGAGGGRDAVQADFSDAFAGRARSTQELRAFAARVRAQAGAGATQLALARAAWAAVAKEILGGGGSFSDDASEVLSRGRGGRLFLLQAVLAELGVRSRVALARPFSSDPTPRRFPSHGAWSAALLRLEADGQVIWHDPSLRTAPLGTVASPALGAEAIVLGAPGEPLEVTRTPEKATVEERRELTLRLALRGDGGADVSGVDRYLGASGAAAKMAVERLDATERRQVVEGMMARTFRGFSLAASEMTGEGDPSAPLEVRWKGAAPAVTRVANGGLVIDAPFQPARLGARYVQMASRTAPLVLPVGEVVVLHVEVEAPEGFVAEPAPAQTVESPFGRLVRTERVDGRLLVRDERLEFLRSRVPPDRYADFAAFASAVDRIQEQPMPFRRAATPFTAPQGATSPPAPVK